MFVWFVYYNIFDILLVFVCDKYYFDCMFGIIKRFLLKLVKNKINKIFEFVFGICKIL